MIQFYIPSWKAYNLLTCRPHHKLLDIIDRVNVSKHIQINFWWIVFVLDRKSVRQSTTEHTRLTYLRLQERQVAPRRRKGTRHERPLTQAELLAEAKVTAEINLRSLGEELITDTFANCSVCKTWMLIAVCDFFFFGRKLWAFGGRQETTGSYEASVCGFCYPISLCAHAPGVGRHS